MDDISSIDKRKDLTNKNIFSDSVGSFWTSFFDDGALSNAVGEIWSSALREYVGDVKACIGSCGHRGIRVFKSVSKFPIIDKTESFLDPNEKPTYGSNLRYGHDFMYGDAIEKRHRYKIKNPGIVKDPDKIYVATDSISFPNSILLCGVDFDILGDYIVFYSNPLANGFKGRGSAEGEEIVVWIAEADIDKNEIYNNLGMLFSTVRDSSNSFKLATTCYLNLLSNGPTYKNIEALLVAASGGVVSLEGEVVLGIHMSVADGTLVETDKNLYQIPDCQRIKPEITIGSEIKAYDSISQVANVINPMRDVHWYRRLECIPSGNVVYGSTQDGVMIPGDESLIARTITSIGANNFMSIRFDVIGSHGNKKNFWDAIDKNIESSGIEIKEDLYSTSPLEFFVDRIANNSIFPIFIDMESVTSNMLRHFYSMLSTIRQILPSYAHCYIFRTYRFDDAFDTQSGSIMSDVDMTTHFTDDTINENIDLPLDSVVIRYRSRCTD